jgi:hypothetical protein
MFLQALSFFPFSVRKKSGQHTPGRIVVHDRSKVESEILPRYFNHASFASLRRQLNYFAFSRVGKGKQKGATYCNEQVIDLLDILRLKRRVVGSTIPVVQSKKFESPAEDKPLKKCTSGTNISASSSNSKAKKAPSSPTPTHAISVESRSGPKVSPKVTKIKKKRKKPSKKMQDIIESVVPVLHLPKRTKVESFPSWSTLADKDVATKGTAPFVTVSPPPQDACMSNSAIMGDPPQITLDLTKPPSTAEYNKPVIPSTPFVKAGNANNNVRYNTKEADVLAGCSALLALGCHSL